MILGPKWDTFSFSLNALDYAGLGTGYYEYDRGPFFPFMVSLFFRLGIVSTKVAMLLDGAFLFIGGIFLYLLVELKCPRFVAFSSALLYVSARAVMQWTAVGYADITSVSLSIMAIYFFVRGMEEHPRMLLLAWPIAMCSFLSRTTAGLILLPMFFYYIFTTFNRRAFKYNILGIFLGIMTYLPVAIFYFSRKGNPLYYIGLILGGLSSSSESTGMDLEMYFHGKYYFIEELGSYLVSGYLYPIYAALIIIGIFLILIKYLSVSRKKANTIIMIVIFSFILFFMFERYSFLFVEMALFFMFSYLFFYSRPKEDQGRTLFCVMMAFWGISYFIFHSGFFQKVPRYYITMMPSFAFVFSVGIYELSKRLDSLTTKVKTTLPIFVIFIIFASVLTAYEVVDETRHDDIVIEHTERMDMLRWMNENIDDFEQSLVYSDDWTAFGWYTKHPILSMPIFFDERYFEHELMKYGVDYYITFHFNELEHSMNLYKNSMFRFIHLVDPVEKPRGLYIGEGWQNYFEYVMDFNCYLLHGETHIQQASVYIDDYTIDELVQYDFLALFNFKWNDAKKAEDLLLDYVDRGGVLIIDCSGNLDDPLYSLNYKQFFNMMVSREGLSLYSEIEYYSSPEIYYFSPFGNNDSKWYGTTYEPINGENNIEIVATVNEDILAMIESYGDGKILWMGFNMLFHAFVNDNPSEMAFIQYLFDEALNK